MLQALLLTLVLSLLPAAAGAQAGTASPAPLQVSRLVLLSLIGDVMTVDIYRPRVGTQIDKNRQTVVGLDNPAFDHAALLAASEAVRQQRPMAAMAMLAVPKADSAFDPNRLLADRSALADDPVLVALRGQGFDHLLAITKLRAPAHLRLYGQTVGSGQLQGLGFYIDPFLRLKNVDTGEFADGFIAPYAYFRLTLIDTNSGAVRGEEAVTASTVRTTAGTPALAIWDAMTPQAKADALRYFVDRSTREAVKRLLPR